MQSFTRQLLAAVLNRLIAVCVRPEKSQLIQQKVRIENKPTHPVRFPKSGAWHSYLSILVFMGMVFSTSAQTVDIVSPSVPITVNQSDTFTVTIAVAPQGGITFTGASIFIDFDPAILEVNSITTSTQSEFELETGVGFDNALGTIDYNGVNDISVNGPPNTGFEVIDISFTAQGAVSTMLTFSSAPGRVTTVVGDSFNNVTGTTNNIPITIGTPNQAPVFNFTIGNQVNDELDVITGIDGSATDPDMPPNAIMYSAMNLPPGVGIDMNSGLISGSIQAGAVAGSPYSVTITAQDDGSPSESATQNFTWTVNAVSVTTYDITTSPGPGGTITPVSATVNEGDNQIFNITPDPGFVTTGILVDGNPVAVGPTYEFMNVMANANISATFALADTAPVITLQSTGTVDEGGSLSIPLSITDADGDNLTVTITSISNEPQELQSGNGGAQTDPYPFDASGFLSESGVSDAPGAYSSSLDFNPVFGDGGSNGDGSGVYTVTVNVQDEDGNSIDQTVDVTVNDVAQFIADTGTTRIEAESYDDQGPANTGSGANGIGVEVNATLTNIGFTTNGDFAEYLIDVQTAGNYQFDFAVAKSSGPNGTLSINGGPASITVSPTGGWQTYITQSTIVALAAGPQTLRFDWSGAGGFFHNIDFFDITLSQAPAIDPVANIFTDQGTPLSVPITVTGNTNPTVSIEVFDVSDGGTNNPFNPTTTVAVPPLVDNTGGSYTFNWTPAVGRSYLARVTADDSTNPAVIEEFFIYVSQPVPATILARTFYDPLPWYGGSPQSPFTIAIESNANQNIGFINNNDFVEYLINVPAPGALQDFPARR